MKQSTGSQPMMTEVEEEETIATPATTLAGMRVNDHPQPFAMSGGVTP
jgi:hypothetical protein